MAPKSEHDQIAERLAEALKQYYEGGKGIDIKKPGMAAVGVEYAGFRIRLGAFVIDLLITLLIAIILSPLGALLYWWLFTGLRGQTPGKMAFGIMVVDKQGNKPGLGRAALREILCKFVFFLGVPVILVFSLCVLLILMVDLDEIVYIFFILFLLWLGVTCLGALSIAWDKEKQGWHDKIAGTYVVKAR